jgi:N-acetylneuraminate 9-O-acetyltransferase
MLQDPIDEAKYRKSYNSTRLTNKKIDYFNRETINLLYHSPITIWSSNRLVSQGHKRHHSDSTIDGLHLGNYVLEIDSQMLVNLYCNNKMIFNDGSCCSQPEAMSLLQKILFSFFFLCCFLSIYLYIYRTYCKNSKLRVNISGSEITLNGGTCKDATSSVGFQTLLNALSKLALIMLYFYLCDRANFFMKENKHYTKLSFLIPFIYVSVLGFFFHESTTITNILNRQQTDEFKGFMQIVILIYGISGANKNLIFYMLVRTFTSSYLFLSGYGHFMYYWNVTNYSLSRFFEILFRLNFLPILLCFTMNRMYQFYSFIPFITFSFIFIYILMIIPPRISSRTVEERSIHYLFMIVKLLIFGGFIAFLNMSEVLFENVFIRRPWKFLFISSDDLIYEWKKTWNHDCYTVLYGMCFALVLIVLKKYYLYLNLNLNIVT